MEQSESLMPMVGVALWALGVIAFLVWFFRRWRTGFLLFVLMVGALIASVVLQVVLMDLRGYADFMAATARVGQVILIVAVIVLVAALATGAVLTIRKGKPEHRKNNVDSGKREDFFPFFASPGSAPGIVRTKIKTLYSAGSYVQVESLVDGTATKSERMIFVAVFAALTSFFLVFVGMSLMWMQESLFMVIFPIGAGLVLYRNLRIAWDLYRAAKEKLAARQIGD